MPVFIPCTMSSRLLDIIAEHAQAGAVVVQACSRPCSQLNLRPSLESLLSLLMHL